MVNARPQVSTELRRAAIHCLIALIAIITAIRGAIGWVEHGFHIPTGHGISPADDGSFILMVFGAFFALYSTVTVVIAIIAAGDAAHRDDTTQTI